MLATRDQVLRELKRKGDPKIVRFKERYGIVAKNSYGVMLKDVDALAKRIGKNDALALELFDSGVYEARLLCSRLFHPENVTERLMEKWVRSFENWEICHTYCMNFMSRTKFVLPKAFEWAEREPEFQKRAGFVLMMAYAFKDPYAPDEVIRSFFPVMVRHANDERKYVMKGINWALRQVGKRNRRLHKEALQVAEEIAAQGTKPARWIASDAIRQLRRPGIHFKNYPKSKSQ